MIMMNTPKKRELTKPEKQAIADEMLAKVNSGVEVEFKQYPAVPKYASIPITPAERAVYEKLLMHCSEQLPSLLSFSLPQFGIPKLGAFARMLDGNVRILINPAITLPGGSVAVTRESDPCVGHGQVQFDVERAMGAIVLHSGRKTYEEWLRRDALLAHKIKDTLEGRWLPDVGTRSNKTIVHFSKTIEVNEPCPCGSGRKFKKCCGSKLNSNA